MTNEPNVSKAVVESAVTTKAKIASKELPEEEKTIEVSTGVIFTVKEVPQVAYVDLRNSLPEPSPPVFYNEEYDREEPNENDPRYLAMHANWEAQMSSAIVDINILFGSEAKYIPSKVKKPDSAEFKDRIKFLLKAMGWSKRDIANIGETESYLFWVKYEACKGSMAEDNSDLGKLFRAISRMSGVPEEDVTEAIDKFRD